MSRFLLESLVDRMDGGDGNVLSRPGAWPDVGGVCADSRRVKPGDVFVAVTGLRDDGKKWIDDACAAGAQALVCEGEYSESLLPVVRVRDARRALGRAASFVHGDPSEHLRVFAVTGTNGKTTVAWILRHLLSKGGIRAGFLGTVGYDVGGGLEPAALTTPDAPSLQRYLARMRDCDLDAAVMEASSHALDLHRLEGTRVEIGIFTNLTRDHLDYHGSMEAYRDAKLALGQITRRAVVFDAGDAAWDSLVELAPEIEICRYQVGEGCVQSPAVQVRVIREDLGGTQVELHFPNGEVVQGHVPLPGIFNVSNAAAAASAAWIAGISAEIIGEVLGSVPAIPGRLERVEPCSAGLPMVFVDFAHTPDAVERVTSEVRRLTSGGLTVVFGCGGDRDRGKRPLMARAATDHADRAIFTNDNPRNEDPQQITDDALAGLSRRCEVELDRARAIEKAIGGAGDGDVVLILGKGHEEGQIVGNEKRPFLDRRVVAEILAQRAGRGGSK